MRATRWCILNRSVVRSAVCFVGWLFVRLFFRFAVRLFGRLGFRSLDRSFGRSFACSLVRLLPRSSPRLFRSFVRSLVSLVLRSFIRSTGHSFSRAFARSFGRLFVVLKLLYFVTDNPPTLPGIDDNKVYVSTTNYQYHDDAEEFLSSEVLSNFGDLLVSYVLVRCESEFAS